MPLERKSKIPLAEGPDCQVLDLNGTEGSAKFQLPNPDLGNDGLTACSVSAGKQSFSNVSSELLNVYKDPDGDRTIERMPLFDDRLQDDFWSYDNRGLKILQLRFYQISTDLNR